MNSRENGISIRNIKERYIKLSIAFMALALHFTFKVHYVRTQHVAKDYSNYDSKY